MLQNGLAEVLCNVVHCLHEMPPTSELALNVIRSDIGLFISAVARVTFGYFRTFALRLVCAAI